MNLRRPGLARALLGLVVALAPIAAQARDSGDPYSHARAEVEAILKPWDPGRGFTVPPGAEFENVFDHAKTRPPLSLRLLNARPDAYRSKWGPPPTLLLGDLLFHAPRLLGPKTTPFGLSCDSCHPNGVATHDIFFPGESDRPGNIDLLFPARIDSADDGIYAPRNVPGLRGIRYLGPYMHDGSKGSIAEVVEGVVSVEFGQPLRDDWRTALTQYVTQFDFLPNPNLDDLGRLTSKASTAAHRGEALFRAPRAQFDGASCATCHLPSSFFTDHLPHRFRHGSGKDTTTPGEAFVTATLMNTAETAPYFFDGSAKGYPEAVELMNARHRLGLSAAQEADLAAYLQAVGAVEGKASAPSVASELERYLVYLDLLLDGPYKDDAQVWSICLETVRHGLGQALHDAPQSAGTPLAPLVAKYQKLIASPSAQAPSDDTRAELAKLRTELLATAHLPDLPDPAVARRERDAHLAKERGQ